MMMLAWRLVEARQRDTRLSDFATATVRRKGLNGPGQGGQRVVGVQGHGARLGKQRLTFGLTEFWKRPTRANRQQGRASRRRLVEIVESQQDVEGGVWC